MREEQQPDREGRLPGEVVETYRQPLPGEVVERYTRPLPGRGALREKGGETLPFLRPAGK